MTTRNPKQAGTRLFDCVPQTGPCPHDCNECFYNRPGAFYTPIDKPHMPTVEEVGEDGILRVCSGNDANNQRELVVSSTAAFKHRFFNTSVPKLNFPGPVVLTVNPQEESPARDCSHPYDMSAPLINLMFVRLRTSPTNYEQVADLAGIWAAVNVPVVITFMRYYTRKPILSGVWLRQIGIEADLAYMWKKSTLNEYWCPTPEYMRAYMAYEFSGNRLVSMCGSPDSGSCSTCLNCEMYYRQTIKRMKGE